MVHSPAPQCRWAAWRPDSDQAPPGGRGRGARCTCFPAAGRWARAPSRPPAGWWCWDAAASSGSAPHPGRLPCSHSPSSASSPPPLLTDSILLQTQGNVMLGYCCITMSLSSPCPSTPKSSSPSSQSPLGRNSTECVSFWVDHQWIQGIFRSAKLHHQHHPCPL